MISQTIDRYLQSVLFYYGLQADIAGLRAINPDFGNFSKPHSLDQTGESLNLQIHERKMTYREVISLDAPAIMLGKKDKFGLILPNDTNTATDVLKEEDYTGVCYVFLPLSGFEHKEKATKKYNSQWFWTLVKREKKSLTYALIGSLFIGMMTLAVPLYTMNIYDRVIPTFSHSTLVVLTIGVIMSFVIDFLLKIARQRILDSVMLKISYSLDYSLMERFYLIPLSQINLTIAEKQHLFSELRSVRDYFIGRFFPALTDVPFFILFVFVIYLLSPTLAIIPVLFGSLIVGFNVISGAYIRTLSAKGHDAEQTLSSILYEALAGVKQARLSRAIGTQLSRWKSSLASNQSVLSDVSTHRAMIQNTGQMLVSLAQIAVVFFGVFEIEKGNLTIGALVAISILAGRGITPIIQLGNIVANYKRSMDMLCAMDKIFTTPHDGEKTQECSGQTIQSSSIDLNKVMFSYPNRDKPALQDVSVSIASGEKIGVIGKNGSGKTTLADVIAGISEPQSGDISIDKQLYSIVSPMELRQKIGYLSSDSFFFTGSIRDNITVGDATVDEKKLKEACLISGVSHMLAQDGTNIDLMIIDGGKSLSDGQKQSIAIARLLYQDPDIIILDEPTNAMDYALEQHFLSKMKSYLKSKTFIMVTHRTTLLPLVDRILHVDNGKIIADMPSKDMIKKVSGGGA